MQQEKVQELIQLCQQLVQTPSYSGQEKAVIEVIRQMFQQYRYDEMIIDEYGSIVGKIQGKFSGPKILLDAHVDTVEVSNPSKWKYDPFGAQFIDGKIYGRGTSDMKGALSAMIAAAAYFVKNRNFPGEIYVAGVVHEECFEGVAARKISKRIQPDYVILGEASELNIKCGQRGRAEIIVETFGKPAHSANPHKGVNAVYQMAKLIQAVQMIVSPNDEVLGKGILELTDMISSPYPGASVVPDYCKVTYDRRLLVDETEEEVLRPLQQVIDHLQKEDSSFQAAVRYAEGRENCYTGNVIEGCRFFPAWLYQEKEDFVVAASNALKSIGMQPKITQYSFCTNGSHYAGEAKIKTLGFGPSRENLAHTVDEYIEVTQLIGAYEGYIQIINALLHLS